MSEEEEVKDRELTAEEKEVVEAINEAINDYKFSNINDVSSLAWIDQVRVGCRVLETRKAIRKNTEIFSIFVELLDKCQEITTYTEKEKLDLEILIVSSLANIVVEDEEEELLTSFAVLKSGLYVRMVQSLQKSLDKAKLEDELKPLYSRLQLVATIAITNLTVQFVQSWKVKDENEKQVLEILLEREDELKAFSLFVEVTAHGADEGIKKAGITLLARMAEFVELRATFLSSPYFDDVLSYILNYLRENQDQEFISQALYCLLSLFGQCSPESAQKFQELCSPLFTEILEINSKWSTNIKHLIIRLFKITVRGRMLMPNEDLTEKESDDIEKKVEILKSTTGLYELVKKNIIILKDELKNTKTLNEWESFEAPNTLLLSHLEFISSFLHPVNETSIEINSLLEDNFDTVLYEIIEFISIFVDISIKDATIKKETDKDHDINRDLVLNYAKVRKSALFLLNILATSKDRCMTLINKEHDLKDLDSRYQFKSNTVYLVLYVLNTMFKFDVEGSENCLTFLKNVFLDESARKHLFHVKLPELSYDFKEFFSNLVLMIKHPAHKVIMLTTNIIRMIFGMRDTELTKLFLTDENMEKLMSYSMKDIHPLLKVEISRMYCYLLELFASNDEFDKLRAMITKDRVEFITFLLQSHHPLLLIEGLKGLKYCELEVLKTVSEEIKLIFMADSEDYSVLELLQEGNLEALEDVFAAVEDVGNLNITEEDVAIHEKPEEELRKEISEKLSRRHEEAAVLKKQAEDRAEEEKEVIGQQPKLENVPVKFRLLQLAKNMFHYEEVETEDHDNIVALAKEVVSRIS